jgi:hypothetical protein
LEKEGLISKVGRRTAQNLYTDGIRKGRIKIANHPADHHDPKCIRNARITGGCMNPTIRERYRWFWPWQDEKEEGWLEEMSQTGWHLKYVHLPCVYGFERGEPSRYSYRLDYMLSNKNKFNEYLQIFQDAGWEYLGEMSNWRYWRKTVLNDEPQEIFTDRESKIKKYQRMLIIMAFFLAFLVFMGTYIFKTATVKLTTRHG